MYLSTRIDKALFPTAALFFVYFLVMVWVNNSYAYFLHEYMGAAQKNVDFEFVSYLAILAAYCSFLCSSKIRTPGDLVVVLLILVLVPHALVLNGANSFAPEASPFSGVPLAVLLGVSLVGLSNKIHFYERDSGEDGRRYIVLLASINIAVLIFIVLKSLGHFSLDFSGQYIRRALARDVFAAGSPSGYIASIGTQAFFPVLFAWGVYKKSSFYFFLGLLNVLVLWGAFGQKYPFFVLVLIYLLMMYFRRHGQIKTAWLLFFAIGFLLLGVVEHEITDYSYINDYFVRRAFVVPSSLLGVADLFASNNVNNGYSDTLIGVLLGSERSDPLSFQMGVSIFNNPDLNANVNFLAISYLQLKYLGVLFEASFVGGVVVLLNYLYACRGSFLAIPVALLFATKILEQSLPTVMLGSGVSFMLLFLVLIAAPPQRRATGSPQQ
ncbi:MAG: hypothetical protein RR736_06835 [Pseudomonas sp.]|uniref:hypothetical protein n=1 Tax=Pseudomonas sp. TaxID=306 RepID=UPI002FCBDAE2